ncbi:hypothetical protein [Streptomyces aureoversilis]|uniref:Uncharacterized protein n=1 Tax=Streptomyces aureoversilis TaxID=67277 RepID=A0ABV9ZZB4_9ACTN
MAAGRRAPRAGPLPAARYARCVDPKTRNRIMTAALAAMLVVVAVVAAVK